MNKLIHSSDQSKNSLKKRINFSNVSIEAFLSIIKSKTVAKDEKSMATVTVYSAVVLLALSAANFPEVNAQALFAPDGESVPITPPTTSPAAYRP